MKIKKFKKENNEKIVLNSSEIYYEEGGKTLDNLINLIYPIGSIYMSTNEISPQTFLGGTWGRIQDRFLLCAGSTYSNGSTGGEAKHTLTANESGLPNHNHPTNSTYANVSGTGPTGGDNHIWPSDGGYYFNYKNSTDNAGGWNASQAHNNMPPYLVVYCWNRTA